MILPLSIPRKTIGKFEYAAEVNVMVSKVNEIAAALGVGQIPEDQVHFKRDGDFYVAAEQNFITAKVNELAGILSVAVLSFGALVNGNDWTSDEFNELVDKINELAILAAWYVPPAFAVYWGIKSDFTVLTKSQILAGTAIAYVPTADITIPFANSSPQALWASWPATETGITNYYINDYDYAALGPGGTFALPVAVGDMLFVQTNYLTQLDTVIFKH